MLLATADGVAKFHISSIPNYVQGADNDYINQEVEKWFASRVALLSNNRPETRILAPLLLASQWTTPSKAHSDELLDWDAAIEVAPMRPSGTLKVTLQYAGRATPSPTREPWD